MIRFTLRIYDKLLHKKFNELARKNNRSFNSEVLEAMKQRLDKK